MSAYDDLWFAIGHIRGAKTKIANARHNHGRVTSAVDELLRAEQRELWKVEQRLIARAKALTDAPAPPRPPRRSAPSKQLPKQEEAQAAAP